MFNSEEWKTSKFGTSQEGRKVQNVVLDSRFWKNVTICLKVVAPLDGLIPKDGLFFLEI